MLIFEGVVLDWQLLDHKSEVLGLDGLGVVVLCEVLLHEPEHVVIHNDEDQHRYFKAFNNVSNRTFVNFQILIVHKSQIGQIALRDDY